MRERRTAGTGGSVRPRRSTRRIVLAFALLLSLGAASAYLAAAVLQRATPLVLPGGSLPVPEAVARVLPGLAATPVEDGPGTTPITILLLGLDRRPHHDPAVDGPPNTDAIELIRLDPVTRTAAALAIPRDLYVELPSPQQTAETWEGRINTAYALGERYHYPGGGEALIRRTVEATFHLPVTYTVVIDWVAFADVLDALGGIDLDVPAPLRHVEAFNPRTFDTKFIDIAAGRQHLDTVTALAYARFRDDADNDFGRARRQQAVMQAAAARALQLDWLGQGVTLYRRFRDAVQTDLPLVRLPGVLNLVRLISVDRVTLGSVAGERAEAVRPVVTPWGEDVLLPLWPQMGALLRAALPDRAVQAEGARVRVRNATGVRGQGARTAAYLTRFALRPDQVTALDEPVSGGRPPQATTLVVSGPAMATARRVAADLGLPETRIRETTDPIVPALDPAAGGLVDVLLGTDLRLPNDERFQRYTPR